ncbi:hypothetical protein [Priestia flexa]|uniref:hypothetical protein n=1 Tax=Priestia flexa TaxID=86664 RepID=UPI000A730921|nr:hypothetical protein [Priestia flexa]
MYYIEWIENGVVKSDVADSWIVRDVWIEQKTELGFNPTCKLVEEVLAERNFEEMK